MHSYPPPSQKLYMVSSLNNFSHKSQLTTAVSTPAMNITGNCIPGPSKGDGWMLLLHVNSSTSTQY